MLNFKKSLSYLAILVIGLSLGLGLTYVSAEYTDQTNNAPGNNTPAPILITDISNVDRPFIKTGKLGISAGSTNADTTKLSTNSIVVGGQTSVINGLSVDGSGDIRAEVPSTSNAPAFFFGNPAGKNTDIPISGDHDFWQLADQNSPRKFIVRGYTKAARVVIGSTTVDPLNYNLYIPTSDLNVSRLYSMNSPREYCTLTANDLKNKGCPIEFQYNSTKKLPTYLSQIIPGTGTEIVGRCNLIIEQVSGGRGSGTSNLNLGKCY